jgi:hypothetical protein
VDPSSDGADRTVRLAGGVVAYNEEGSIRRSLESLLTQELPEGVAWSAIWVVASGCTDATVACAEEIARDHPEIRVLVQPERLGKAAALREIFARAVGDYLVLLNADASAEPRAARALLESATTAAGPFAVMGRPVPLAGMRGDFSPSVDLLWEVHHLVHAELTRNGSGTHLSDELVLLPIAHLPELPAEVVNDGAYIGAWLRAIGGRILYAQDARVRIEVPTGFAEHVRQRRRIRYGHEQVASLMHEHPTTWDRLLLGQPGPALRLLREALRTHSRHAWRALAGLVTAESTAVALARWDRLIRRPNYRLWTPVRTETSTGLARPAKENS